MLRFACVLKSGGDFKPEDAHALFCGVARNFLMPHEFVCLTDMDFEIEGITNIPLTDNLPGWWSVLEMLKLTGPVITTGLDTIIVSNIDRLGEIALTCPEDVFYMTRPQKKGKRKKKSKYCSGIMLWNGNWSYLFDAFKPKEHIKRFYGEQRYTSWRLVEDKVNVRVIQDDFDGFYSFKNDIQRAGKLINNDVKIVAFHGKPRPADCKDKILRSIYSDRSLPKHYLADLAKQKREANV